jgi:HlyD family secretion protein
MGLSLSPIEPTTRPTPPAPAPPGRPRPRRLASLGRPLLWMLLGAVLTLAAGPLLNPARPADAPVPVPTVTSLRLTARGEVRPLARASVRTIGGGTVSRLVAQVGQSVGEQDELARVKGTNGEIEVLSAPWRGTVTAVPIHYGDTLTPGDVVAMIGDLSRLTVETTDVDEFIVGQLKPGQLVSLTVDALDRQTLSGTIRTVGLLPEKNESGDDHYPVTIDLRGATAALRLGMTVRVSFLP